MSEAAGPAAVPDPAADPAAVDDGFDPARVIAPQGAAGHPAPSPAADFSFALIGQFVGLGVSDAVLTPGSRSQALALALAEFDRARMLDLQVRIDERVAGFTALGLAAETQRPAIVVTTSGTAVANLMPAVLEAHHSRVPMLLITSDRPASMRGTAGNQTTWQPGLFGRFVRQAVDVAAPTGDPGEPVAAAALAQSAMDAAFGTHTGNPGPVHINLQLREPLSGAVPDLVALLAAGEWMPGVAAARASADLAPTAAIDSARLAAGDVAAVADGGGRGDAARLDGVAGVAVQEGPGTGNDAVREGAEPLVLGRGPRTVVIAGHDAGPGAEELAHRGGWPLIAEPSSGARYGRNLIVAYRELLAPTELGAEFGGRVERAIVFGHPTLSRELPALSLQSGVETIVVTPAAAAIAPGETVVDAYNPGHRVSTFVTAVDVAAWPPAPLWAAPPSVNAAAESVGGEAVVGDRGEADDREAFGDRVAQADREARGARDVAGEERAWLREWVLTSRALVESQSADDPIPAPNIEFANSPDIAERRAYRLAETAALKAPVTRRTLALAVWQATWPHDRLVLGASRLIRDLDRAAPGKKIHVHANRGLAGIDGTIATATGIALASQREPLPVLPAGPAAAAEAESRTDAATSATRERAPRASVGQAAHEARQPAMQHGVTRVLLGDLTLLHDAGALLFGTGERRPRIQLIVANDGGGTIFDTLEVAATADRAAFDRVMLTPQAVDLEALARAYGWAYTRVTTRVELDRALTAPLTAPTLLEVPLPR